MIVTIERCRNCNGGRHEWVFDGPTLLELRRIKQLTGLTATTMDQAINEADPDALAALLDLLHRRQNIIIPWDEIDLDFGAFTMRPDAEEQEAAAAREQQVAEGKSPAPPTAPDPTPHGVPTGADSRAWSATTPQASGGISD